MSGCETHASTRLAKDGNSSLTNWCPECRQRICLRCSKVAPESWMSGSCHDCYLIISRENKARQAEYARKRELEKLADAWEQGCRAGSGSSSTRNPYLEAVQEAAA